MGCRWVRVAPASCAWALQQPTQVHKHCDHSRKQLLEGEPRSHHSGQNERLEDGFDHNTVSQASNLSINVLLLRTAMPMFLLTNYCYFLKLEI